MIINDVDRQAFYNTTMKHVKIFFLNKEKAPDFEQKGNPWN